MEGKQMSDDQTFRGGSFTELRAHWERCSKLDINFRTPQEKQLLVAMQASISELKKLGWTEIIYCPKDGTEFLCLTGIDPQVHRCIYQGKWPEGFWWILEAGDMWPARPILWKPLPNPALVPSQ